jgi:hypothetical protein
MVKEVDSKAPKGGRADANDVIDFGRPRPGPGGPSLDGVGTGADALMVKEVDSKAPKGGGAGDAMVKEVDSEGPKPAEAAGLVKSLQSQVANNPTSALANATANLNPATATRLI